jgi:hypothetical protein
MKITFKPLAKALFALSSLLLLNSCIKKVENTGSAQTGKATVKGRIRAELNTTNADPEPYPNATVYIFVDSKAYAKTPGSGVYPLRRFETKTDGEGNYSLEIEVPLNGVAATVTVPGFIYNVQTSGGLLRTVFGETSVNAGTAKDGSVLVKDIDL